jgi:hypothetical protein
VDDPTQVRVSEHKRGPKTEISLQVAQDDMGRVIGRHGKVANAMRALLQVAAAREDENAFLNITEPE